MSRKRLAIVVAGSISAVPEQGGWTWVILQYLLGLRRLGHRVTFVDPLPPESVQPAGARLVDSTNAAYFVDVVRRFELEHMSALLLGGASRQTIGASHQEITRAIRDADLLINVSGVLRDEALLALARRRIYLDLDPAFTQLWHAVEGIDMGFAQHTDFVTIGPAIGTSACAVPTCDRSWIGTVQPVVLEQWPAMTGGARDALTTVANWRGYGSIKHAGMLYGQKAHAARPLFALPSLTGQRFVLALAIHHDEIADRAALAEHGWEIVAPSAVTATPDAYRRFVSSSKGEIGIAKTGYIASGCGWISDRSICYLASGRPVVAQDTGFSRFVPAGDGLLPFNTLEDARDAVHRLRTDYHRHARAARALAEEYFDSDRVLTSLLSRIGTTPVSSSTFTDATRQ